ncbi:Dimethylaniline monooxygenase [N-oxide-forming] 5 [Colletotrichum spinosum]|uniref:Dimethylaniline monooxygenase [N-oxide-forming] 5 n=1 Tax=Colletotrichum spinosum TaxID=1347390 RepID=A0A4R8QJE0_9PEZI|nr:Dimethylaniline monooxygenase [N-oxide-forming] 5 [Colletotrichum spinosum]
MSSSKNIAVVGAGPSGLAAIKEFIAAGHTVQCFEGAHALGGIWLYEPSPTEDTHSVAYNGLVLNSCRETTGFSDFPIDPQRYPIFYSHRLHLRYLQEYAARFGLEKHIRYKTTVVGCAPRKDGTWEVRVRDNGADDQREEVSEFDAVVCGSGFVSKPMVPRVDGRDKFKGEVLHGHFYRTPTAFEGKKVVVIGLGSTAVDIACEAGPLAKKLDLVNKRGAWIVPRFILGKPAEAWNNRSSATWLPFSVQAYLFELIFHHALGKQPAILQPHHKIMEQNPTVRSDFTEKLKSGVFDLHRNDVAAFTETGILLDDGTALDADVVIFCTGYHRANYPYLPPGALASQDAPYPHMDLYKLLVSPRHENLFVLGQVEAPGPLAPLAEAQARYVAAVLAGKIELPGRGDMMEDIRAFREWQTGHYVNSQRHAVSADYCRYIDALMGPLGAVPSGWTLFGRIFTSGSPLRAWRLYSAVFFEIQTAAQWRLLGDGSRRELAEETLLRVAAGGEVLTDVERASL